MLQYNGTDWVNSTVNTGTSLELLSDTNIINKQNNDILTYNSTSGLWENKAVSTAVHKYFRLCCIDETGFQLPTPTTLYGVSNVL